jgi:hypothetical protein
MFDAIYRVLSLNNGQLQEIVNRIKNKKMEETELILLLSTLLASYATLEEITGANIPKFRTVNLGANRGLTFETDTEDDNPEAEDIEIKRAREEDQRFFG